MTEPPLYARVLGDAWTSLPAPIREMHDVRGEARATGLADVERGNGIAARLIAAVMGLPAAGRDVPVDVRFTTDARGGELWQRSFAGRRLTSYQFARAGQAEPIVYERLGPTCIALRLRATETRLEISPHAWSFCGFPLPKALNPMREAFEMVDAQGRFNFHVEIAHPWVGLIVRYRGHLERVV